MPVKKKLKWETFQNSYEYALWKNLSYVYKQIEKKQGDYMKLKDFGGLYWEPLLDRLLKLGVYLKINHKLKELRMDWIRPVLFLPEDANTGKIKYDGRVDEVDKEAVANAINIQMVLKNLVQIIKNVDEIKDDKTLQEYWKPFRKEVNDLFLRVSIFVKKGWRQMHEHVKLLLKPLRSLRKAGYRLYTIEQLEKYNYDLNEFKCKDSMSKFLDDTREWFDWDKYILGKDPDMQKLESFMNRPIESDIFHFTVTENFRKKEEIVTYNNIQLEKAKKDLLSETQVMNYKPPEKNNSNANILPSIINKRSKDIIKDKDAQKKLLAEEEKKKKLIFPNIKDLEQPEPTRFRYEVYQLKFEEGLDEMLVYLQSKLPNAFTDYIDTHKIFINSRLIPSGREQPATKYWLDKLDEQVHLLKRKCYDLKVNGLSRVLLPASANKDIIQTIKDVFDLHIAIDRVMGNYLLYDQYIFIYDKVKFLQESSIRNKLKKYKNNFMEEIIPKYVFYEALSHAVDVMDKMELFAREKGDYFKQKNFYQIHFYELEGENSKLIHEYELTKDLKPYYREDTDKEKKKLYDEIKQFGRFWILEGFFDKKDKELWLKAIDVLYTINKLVREDIRDYILTSADKNDGQEGQRAYDYSSHTSSNKDLGKKKNAKSLAKKKIPDRKSKLKRKKTSSSFHSLNDSVDSTGAKKVVNLNLLRPPSVWNFPVDKILKIKKEKFIKEKENDKDKFINEVRTVDPKVNYSDGRVERFLELFEQIYENVQAYFGKIGNTWLIFFDEVLSALKIEYEPFVNKHNNKKERETIFTKDELIELEYRNQMENDVVNSDQNNEEEDNKY